jgi:hypothetical protein
MSETATLEVLQKKRTELEDQWSSKLNKQKVLEGEIKALEEKVQSQLQEKINSEDSLLQTLESKKKELENRSVELQGHQETDQKPSESLTAVTATNEQVQEQPVEMTTTVAAEGDHVQNDEIKERHREERRRRW